MKVSFSGIAQVMCLLGCTCLPLLWVSERPWRPVMRSCTGLKIGRMRRIAYCLIVSEPGFGGFSTKSFKNHVFKSNLGLRTSLNS